MAVIFKSPKPARLRSTALFKIENGSANTTLSAVTSKVRRPLWKVTVQLPAAVRRTATSPAPVTICGPSAAASAVKIWSLPPRTRYFSFDAPKRLNWPGLL